MIPIRKKNPNSQTGFKQSLESINMPFISRFNSLSIPLKVLVSAGIILLLTLFLISFLVAIIPELDDWVKSNPGLVLNLILTLGTWTLALMAISNTLIERESKKREVLDTLITDYSDYVKNSHFQYCPDEDIQGVHTGEGSNAFFVMRKALEDTTSINNNYYGNYESMRNYHYGKIGPFIKKMESVLEALSTLDESLDKGRYKDRIKSTVSEYEQSFLLYEGLFRAKIRGDFDFLEKLCGNEIIEDVLSKFDGESNLEVLSKIKILSDSQESYKCPETISEILQSRCKNLH